MLWQTSLAKTSFFIATSSLLRTESPADGKASELAALFALKWAEGDVAVCLEDIHVNVAANAKLGSYRQNECVAFWE
jgi:hypothetical protein